MRTYSEREHCPACGASNMEVLFVKAGERMWYPGALTAHDHDRLIVSCRRCRYSEERAPVNALPNKRASAWKEEKT